MLKEKVLLALEFMVETRICTRVANRSLLLHHIKQRVVVAVRDDSFDFLRVPRGFTLHP